MLESCITFEPGVFEIEEQALFDVSEPVWILGKRYAPALDFTYIKKHLLSVIWLTYRRNFQAIGGTGPTSDQGWGCMLRCGQMLLAQALVHRHMGKDWRWDPKLKNQIYLTIVRQFQDKKHKMYSIHQIAQMGVSEGKEVGQWFGPNTVAQVLKKLTVYDDWSLLAVHVSMDNLVIADDVKQVCRCRPQRRRDSSEGSMSPAPLECVSDNQSFWRPLLLLVPLRLGLTSLNSCYISAIKEFFTLPQSVGIIGGRPNHALYFVGTVGEDLLYLDPHVCQNSVDLDVPLDRLDDSSFHCPFVLHMPLASVDPSLALGLYCGSEAEFDDLCVTLRQRLLPQSEPPLFELLDKRPESFPKFVPYMGEETPKMKDFTVVDSHYDSEDEFEVLDMP